MDAKFNKEAPEQQNGNTNVNLDKVPHASKQKDGNASKRLVKELCANLNVPVNGYGHICVCNSGYGICVVMQISVWFLRRVVLLALSLCLSASLLGGCQEH